MYGATSAYSEGPSLGDDAVGSSVPASLTSMSEPRSYIDQTFQFEDKSLALRNLLDTPTTRAADDKKDKTEHKLGAHHSKLDNSGIENNDGEDDDGRYLLKEAGTSRTNDHNGSFTGQHVPVKTIQSLNSKTITPKQSASGSIAFDKQTITLPDETTVKLLKHFHNELLNQRDCKVTFKDTILTVEGPSKMIERLKIEIKIKLQHLRSIQSISIDVSSVDVEDIRHENKRFNDSRVFCLLSESKQEMEFYAHDQHDLDTSTHKMKKALGLLKQTARSQRTFKDSKFVRLLSLPSSRKATSTLTQQPFSWSRDAQYIELFKTKEYVMVKVYVADILRAPVDCIVNAANRTLEHGEGVAKAISKAAGRDLDKESAMHVKRYGKLNVGTACITTPGNLPFQCVVHAVGPCWEHYKPYTLTKINTCETDLFNAVLSALYEASKYRPHLKRIAFPAISSAIYGCPDELCCVQYAKAVLEFSKATGSKQGFEEIHFVDVNVGIVKLIQDTFAIMIPKGIIPKSYDKMQYLQKYGAASAAQTHTKGMRVRCISPKLDSDSDDGGFKQRSASSETTKLLYPYLSKDMSDSVTCKMSWKITLIVKFGNMMGLTNKDMIACSSKPNGGGDGFIAKAIESKGGKVYKESKKKQFNMEKAKFGDVIVCDGGSSPFKHVAHVILFRKADTKDELDRETKAKNVFIKLFMSTHKHKCRSLALSLVGTGKGKAHPKLFASLLFESLNEFARHSSENLSVYLMNNDKKQNADAIEVIKIAISKQSGKTTFWHVPASSALNSTNPKVPTGRKSESFRQSLGRGRGRGNDRFARSSYPNKRAPTDFVPSRETSTKGSDMSIKLAKQDVKDHGIAFDGEYDVDRGVRSNQTVTVETDRVTKYTDSRIDGSFEHISADDIEQCVICMDSVTNAQTLDCKHVFCKECIQQQFKHMKVCPICGAICGKIRGDQPKGTMDITTTKYPSLAGFEKDGRIDITYTFQSGHQGKPMNHSTKESDCILTVDLPDSKSNSDCQGSIVTIPRGCDIKREINASSQDDETLDSDMYGSITTTKPDVQGISDSDMYGSITTTKPNIQGISDSDMYGSITTTKVDQGASYSSDEDDTQNDTFAIILRCKRRRGGYSKSFHNAGSRDEALKWRYMFKNDTRLQEFKQKIRLVCDLVELSIDSNVAEIECENAKPAVIEENVKQFVSYGTSDLRVKEFSIKMEESLKVVDVLKTTRTNFSDKTVSVFIESSVCYLVCPAHVFENNMVALQKAHEFIAALPSD